MAMLQVLPEMIGAEKLFRLIAFTEFMSIGEMGNAVVPVRLWFPCKLLPAIPADVHGSHGLCWRRTLVGGLGSDAAGRMKGTFVVAGQSRA